MDTTFPKKYRYRVLPQILGVGCAVIYFLFSLAFFASLKVNRLDYRFLIIITVFFIMFCFLAYFTLYLISTFYLLTEKELIKKNIFGKRIVAWKDIKGMHIENRGLPLDPSTRANCLILTTNKNKIIIVYDLLKNKTGFYNTIKKLIISTDKDNLKIK